MPNFTDALGLFAVAATCAGAVVAMVRRRLDGRATMVLFLALCLGLFVPVAGLPLAAYVRGVIGDPSVSTLVLVGALLGAPKTPGVTAGRRAASLLVVLAAAMLLYPLALGAGFLDPYRWGFGQPWFVGSVLLLGLIAHVLRLPLLAPAIALAVLGWSLGCYESRNLWDYLLDPMLATYAFFALIRLRFHGT